jgi:hypothetical protein
MKLKAMHLYRCLYADPFWRWYGKKVCILAARYYLGIDSIDDFKRRVHIGGRRYERPTQMSLLNGKQRRWIKDNEEKVKAVLAEVTNSFEQKTLEVPVCEELLLDENALPKWCEKVFCAEASYRGYQLIGRVTIERIEGSSEFVLVTGSVRQINE